jgi:hypothetical protein
MTAIKSTDLRAHNNEVVIEITSLLEQDRNGSLDNKGRTRLADLLSEKSQLAKRSNDVIDTILSFDFTREQLRAALAIARKTDGWQFAKLTADEIGKTSLLGPLIAGETMGELEKMGVIARGEDGLEIGISHRLLLAIERIQELRAEIDALLDEDRSIGLDRLGRAHVGLLLGEINELRKGRGLNRLAEASKGDCNA